MIDINKVGKFTDSWTKWIGNGEPKAIFKSFRKQYKQALKIRSKWVKASLSYQCCTTGEERDSAGKEISELKREYSSIMMSILIKHLKVCGADFGDIEKELKEAIKD